MLAQVLDERHQHKGDGEALFGELDIEPTTQS